MDNRQRFITNIVIENCHCLIDYIKIKCELRVLI